jgi:hypothetical protein
VYACRHETSLHWGRARRHRFDDPDGEFGVLYVGSDECCAFVESFGDSRAADGAIEIELADLDAKCLASLTVGKGITVIDLTGPGLANIGADGRLCSGDRYDISQAWSRAIWLHPSKPHGIYYRARHDQSRTSLALFDRVPPDGIREVLHGSLTQRSNTEFLTRILSTYRVSLLPSLAGRMTLDQ